MPGFRGFRSRAAIHLLRGGPGTRGRSAVGLLLACVLVGCTSAPTPDRESQGSDAEVEQWYFWTDDDVRHFALELGPADGSGEPIIVIHGGWGAEHGYLLDAVEPLADRFRFVLYDQRGSLRSPAPDSTLRIGTLVEDLEHLRRSLGLDRVVLAGHSMGNALIYAYLSRYPERVRGVVLTGPVHPARYERGANMAFAREVWPEADSALLADQFRDFLADSRRRAAREMQRAGLLAEGDGFAESETLDDLVQRLGLTDRDRTRAWRMNFAAVNSCTGDRWRRMKGGMVFYSQATANEIVGGSDYAAWTDGFWPALRSFPGPTTVIIGTCDYADLGPTLWPHVVERLVDGSLTVIDGAGHTLWLDRPGEFRAALREALLRAGADEAG